jgi:hypothetical protein
MALYKNKRITRRGIQICLGLLWLLDGVLQLQHQMFTSNFANNVIAPAAQGQPGFVSGPMHLGITIILLNPVFFDACFALIQLGLGIAILWKRTTKYGLMASVFWGLGVWICGEGLAGIASGHASLLMGAPGAALLYVIIALAVMPPKSTDDKADTQPAYWLSLVWATLWIGGGIFQLLPGQGSVSSLSSMILGNASGAPSWLAVIDTHTASFINGLGNHTTSMVGIHMSMAQMAQMPTQPQSGDWFILTLALIQFLIGIGIFYKGYWRKLALIFGILLSVVFWVVGQSLGGYYTGLATDPNSAPLFILLAVAIFGCTQLDHKLTHLSKQIEYKLVGRSS